jgi:hypothetical protein
MITIRGQQIKGYLYRKKSNGKVCGAKDSHTKVMVNIIALPVKPSMSQNPVSIVVTKFLTYIRKVVSWLHFLEANITVYQ